MSTRLEFEIIFKSDYHVGAGYGLGLQVDSALLRDPDNIPVIRGTVLAGLLRERLKELLSLAPFDNQRHTEDETKSCLECSIFGSSKQKKRWRISSARPEGLMTPQAPSDNWRAGETAAQITTRVRVNPCTRRAEENKLFTREEGNGSLQFRFIAECDSDDDQVQQEIELLVAAARMLRNLGAGKRRGYGECEIHLVDREQEADILARFERRLRGQPVEAVSAVPTIDVAALTLPASSRNHTYRLRVLLRLDEPLLIARRAEAGNQFETLETIPGSVLRGALAWRIAQRFSQHWQPDSVEYQHFVGLFYQGLAHFSLLTPVELNQDRTSGYPTIVAPRDLVTCELRPGYQTPGKDQDRGDKGHGVWSLFANPPSECPECAKPDTANGRKGSSVKLDTLSGFISLVEGAPRSKHRPRQTAEMHIRIDPASGRVRTGDLYGYVALEPGQYFVGEITCVDETVWQALQMMANLQPNGQINELRLGKATQRGYGKVSAVFQPIEQSLFHLQELSARLNATERITILLLSDAIIPDPWGRFWRGFDPGWLKQELNLPDGVEVTIDQVNGELLVCSATRTVDSFNATLGLPRARDIAIVAGSSARISFRGIALDDLRKLLAVVEAQGIGLRRDEGFGRVAFNHPVYTQLQNVQIPSLDLSPIVPTASEVSHPVMRILKFTLAWAQKLDQQNFKSCTDARFESVARLLHTSQHTSLEPIRSELQRMGRGATLPGRDKPNFFESEGQPGMNVIDELLNDLEQQLRADHLADNPQAWQIGLQTLAARISGAIRQSDQTGRNS
ncbi:RAMP superfamily CRISPR-associated protein [Chloroflexus sp.]|uniref:RAMP superfamily CRISPR-associated protein n=1 Tax=Chloroflexus sp. TaxID=1904827 RepID=UPI00262FD31A|nr:RAMP superfamily CRISPR-associated protein [uncultured Chloroflexus sp.]